MSTITTNSLEPSHHDFDEYYMMESKLFDLDKIRDTPEYIVKNYKNSSKYFGQVD
jgi:hypothetical protein